MNKRSQIQMMETIAILFVFLLIVVIGFMFYARVARENIGFINEETIQQKAVKVALRARDLPELRFTESNVQRESIDLLKLPKAYELIGSNPDLYYDKLEFSNITVEEIYPTPQVYTIYNNTLPEEEIGHIITTYVPILIRDSSVRQESYAFGLMTIEYQVRK